MASAAVTSAAHAAGKEVLVWTTNTPHMVRRALASAADAMVTDVPAEAQRLVRAAWEQCSDLKP